MKKWLLLVVLLIGERTTTDQRRPATGIGNDDPTACEFNRATTGVADATDFVDKTI